MAAPTFTAPAPTSAATLWRWATPQAEQVLQRRRLGEILKYHRMINGLSQTALGAALGYDKTYISLLENGRRTILDLPSLRHIARTLALPAHALGATDPSDADFAALLQFGDSTVRLAETARQSGNAVDAVRELWSLVARLEARATDCHPERAALALLARARVGLGVALGHVLPEERLATAARWTGSGVSLARRLDDPAFHAYALRMHGNELRKAGLHEAALDRLHRACALAPTRTDRAAALALLARAAGAANRPSLFDEVVEEGRRLLDSAEHGSLFNAFALHEIQLRGLAATSRTREAAGLLDRAPQAGAHTTAQWRIIEHITVGQVLLRHGDSAAARERLSAGLTGAAAHHLPHQLQRVLRASRSVPDLHEQASVALRDLEIGMAA
ncbi:helix-turn-helix domain-containing protein [Kitasatospora sp. NBC_01287]|uniref:helix-turn-helix domain-containing protein n=1 Tax=Kitasatospora sp. NBC_01287 TaxID=2903573 RepID=UPI00225BC3E2|nr:helix-turn-helix transcriptional regulator [Kitasatospora sp. NBC_01287]MCX4750563.1 helix-turn-helix domain-containing protein [Kitasatospora sp. NBC_01287]